MYGLLDNEPDDQPGKSPGVQPLGAEPEMLR